MKAALARERFGPPRFVLAALVLFGLVTGLGLMVEGYNADDWRHLAGDYVPWTATEGRWAMEVIFRDLLGDRFRMPLQLVLAFLCFLAMSWIIARAVAPAPQWRAIAALLLFAAGVNYPYMADALNFNAHVFAYPFAMLLSLGSFWLLVACLGRPWWFWPPATLVAAQGIALSYGIFQPFAVFGAVLPMLALLRWDRHRLGPVTVLMLACAVAAALAIVIHGAEWQSYMAAQGREIVESRFGLPSGDRFLQKLSRLPFTLSLTLKGALVVPFTPIRMLLLGFSLLALTAPVLASLWRVREGDTAAGVLEVLRAALASTVLIVVFPSVFFFIAGPGEWPPRAVGYLGFWIAALILSAVAIHAGAVRDRPARPVAGLAMAALGLFAALNVALSALIWHDRAAASRAELALASRIHAAVVALNGYGGQTIRLVGDPAMPTFRWGGAMATPVFHHNNPHMGIISRTFGLENLEQAVSVTPRTCPAFPAPGSVFLEGDFAYVCLETKDALLPLAECDADDDPALGRLCRKGTEFVRVFDRCPELPDRDHQVRIQVDNPDGKVREVYLNDNFPFTELAGRCYQVADVLPKGPATLTLSWLPIAAGVERRRMVSFP